MRNKFSIIISLLKNQFMSLEVSFPDEDNKKSIEKYYTEKQFRKKFSESCFISFGALNAFTYTLSSKNNGQWHFWKCEACEAYLEYQRQQFTGKYFLKNMNMMHLHKASHFQGFDQQKLRLNIGSPKFLVFPIETTQEYKSKEQIIQRTLQQWESNFPGLTCCYSITQNFNELTKTDELIFQCKYKNIVLFGTFCQWRLVYKFDHLHQKWLLDQKKNMHRHYFNIEKKYYGKQQHKRIQKDDKLNIQQNSRVQEFSIHSQKNYVNRLIDGYNKVFKQSKKPLYQTLEMLLKSLRKQHMEIRYKHRNQLINTEQFVDIEEDILIISSKMMKFMSKSYGKVVYLQDQQILQKISDNIDNKEQDQEDIYSILSFYGFNHGYQMVFFCFGVIRNFNTDKGVKIFDKIKNNYLCSLETLVINQEDTRIIRTMQHYPPNKKSFYICTKGYPQNQELKNYIADGNKHYLNVELKKYSMFGNDQLNETQMEFEQNKHWFTDYNNCFIGLNFDLEGIQIQSKLLQSIKNSSNIVAFEYQFIQLIKQANKRNQIWFKTNKEKSQYQTIFMGREDIRKCRLMMGKNPFRKLIQQILLLPTVNITCTDRSTFYIINDEIYPYIVSKKNSKWLCECGFNRKTGIPCVHELKVLTYQQINYFEGTNIFWVMDQAIVNLQPNPQKANNPFQPKRKRRLGRRKLIA